MTKNDPPATAISSPEASPFQFIYSTNFPELLELLQASLWITTYQAGKVVVVRSRSGRLSTLLRDFEKPMGLAVDPNRLTLGTRGQIWFLFNDPGVARHLPPAGTHDG